jgi:hypothetical protein
VFYAPAIASKGAFSNATILLTNTITVSAVFLDGDTEELFDQRTKTQIGSVKERISIWFESTNLSWGARQVISADLEHVYSMCSTVRVFAVKPEDGPSNLRHLKFSHGLVFHPALAPNSLKEIVARYQNGQFELVVHRELVDKYVEQMDLVKAHEAAYQKFQDLSVRLANRDFASVFANGPSDSEKVYVEVEEETLPINFDYSAHFQKIGLRNLRMPSLLSFFSMEYRGRRELFCGAVVEMERRITPWPFIYFNGAWRWFYPRLP